MHSVIMAVQSARNSVTGTPCARPTASVAALFRTKSSPWDVRDLLDPSFSKKAKVVNEVATKIVAGGLNSIWPTKSKNGATIAAPGGHPPQNASDIAKQIVGLAGHSASPHSTALVLNVSPSTARFWTNVDLKATLRARFSEQGNQLFLNSPRYTSLGANCWSQSFCIVDKLTIRM